MEYTEHAKQQKFYKIIKNLPPPRYIISRE